MLVGLEYIFFKVYFQDNWFLFVSFWDNRFLFVYNFLVLFDFVV